MPNCLACGKEIGCWTDELCSYCEEQVKQADKVYALRFAYERLIETLDCRDNSCPYKKKNEHGVYGMRTNGGCRCLSMNTLPNHQRRALKKLLHEVKEFLGQV